MLSFNNDDGRWYLLTPRFDGRMKAIPVVNEDEIGFITNTVIPFGDEGQPIIN
ncbi:MAG: hypothetical protein P4M04_07610 [Acidobacteriota bacterium]|nr:hypothetical protein [Acidobacteriota bacterium]